MAVIRTSWPQLSHYWARSLNEAERPNWPSLQGRNRRCVTIDLRVEEGRKLLKRLSEHVDVLIENFRPGVMEKWGLGPKVSCCLLSQRSLTLYPLQPLRTSQGLSRNMKPPAGPEELPDIHTHLRIWADRTQGSARGVREGHAIPAACSGE